MECFLFLTITARVNSSDDPIDICYKTFSLDSVLWWLFHFRSDAIWASFCLLLFFISILREIFLWLYSGHASSRSRRYKETKLFNFLRLAKKCILSIKSFWAARSAAAEGPYQANFVEIFSPRSIYRGDLLNLSYSFSVGNEPSGQRANNFL